MNPRHYSLNIVSPVDFTDIHEGADTSVCHHTVFFAQPVT